MGQRDSKRWLKRDSRRLPSVDFMPRIIFDPHVITGIMPISSRQVALSLMCLGVAAGGWSTPLSARPQAIAPPVEVAKVFPDVHLRLPHWVEPEIAEAFGQPETLVIKDVEEQMRFAIWLSRQNVEHGTGGPFGAAIFEIESGRLVAPGVILVVPQHCSVAHGEFTALTVAE